jgi:CRP-like cAMP-binding protein
MDAVIDAFQEKTIDENTLIIDAQVQKKDQMYIIKEGLAAVLKPIGMEMFGSLGGIRPAEKLLRPGDLFGEIAVFYNVARTASVRAKTKMTVWYIKLWVLLLSFSSKQVIANTTRKC